MACVNWLAAFGARRNRARSAAANPAGTDERSAASGCTVKTARIDSSRHVLSMHSSAQGECTDPSSPTTSKALEERCAVIVA